MGNVKRSKTQRGQVFAVGMLAGCCRLGASGGLGDNSRRSGAVSLHARQECGGSKVTAGSEGYGLTVNGMGYVHQDCKKGR